MGIHTPPISVFFTVTVIEKVLCPSLGALLAVHVRGLHARHVVLGYPFLHRLSWLLTLLKQCQPCLSPQGSDIYFNLVIRALEQVQLLFQREVRLSQPADLRRHLLRLTQKEIKIKYSKWVDLVNGPV